MKNIHILPTDKPSRLYLGNNGNFVFGMMKTSIQSINDDFTNQNIYITSDEEIKEGDWFLFANKEVKKADRFSCNSLCKKIILTTDQDLIKDGVQEISEYFLEWFVAHPSCEFVDIKKGYKNPNSKSFLSEVYKIYVPTEKFKQEALNHFLFTSSVIVKDPQTNNFNKQETLEEAAETSAIEQFEAGNSAYILGFIEGAKWQMERSYSEQEVNEIIAEAWNSCEDNEGETFTEVRKRIIEQFKKK